MSTEPRGDAAEQLESPAARRFVSALRALEDRGDVDAMADVGTAETRWWGVGGHSELRGSDGARRFWERYRRAFAAISSEFAAVTESRGRVVLEWTGTGQHHNGQPVRYDGVTVLDLDDSAEEQRVGAVRLYFDTLAATEAAPDAGGGSAQDDGMLDAETSAAGHNSGLAT